MPKFVWDRTLEYHEGLQMDTAPARCELCGAELTGAGADHPDWSAAACLRRFAHLFFEDPIAGRALLRLILTPNASYRELAEDIGRSHQTVWAHLQRALVKYPALAPLINHNTPRAHAQRARRQREREQQHHANSHTDTIRGRRKGNDQEKEPQG